MWEKSRNWVCGNMLERAIYYEKYSGIDYWMNKVEGKNTLNHCLAYACNTGKTESVKYFLKLNADINYKDNFPLFLAIKGDHLETVKLLVQNGANVTCHELLVAIIFYKKYIVKYIVENCNVDINYDNGIPLREAAFQPFSSYEQRISEEILDYLISKGADIKLAIKSSAYNNIKAKLLSKYLLQKFDKDEL